MTRKEAIANLNMISVAFVEPVTKEQRELIDDTFYMAIKALEQLTSYEQTINKLTGAIAEQKSLKQEPCEDAISRQAVLNLFNKSDNYSWEMSWLKRKIEKIPPVKPQEPKTGHWIEVVDEIDSLGNKTWHHKCSICGNEDSGWGNYKYCPNCGARMESEE